MRIQTFCENTWLYPDTPCEGGAADASVSLHAARGGTVGFQVLGDAQLGSELPFELSFSCDAPVECVPYQLLPVTVEENQPRL